MLTTTLYAMSVPPVNVKVYKALVIIVIVAAGSPVIKNKLTALRNRTRSRGEQSAEEKKGAKV